jgi:hypothetical protein
MVVMLLLITALLLAVLTVSHLLKVQTAAIPVRVERARSLRRRR